MALDDAQGKKLQKWLTEKGVLVHSCSACGNNQWTAGDIIIGNKYQPGGGIGIGGGGVPMVQVICNNCASVRLFAAVPIGLLK